MTSASSSRTMRQPGQDSPDRHPLVSSSSSSSSAAALTARESACRSLRILLPILALYTLFSLAWTTPIASVLHSVSTGTTVKRRTPKADVGPTAPAVDGATGPDKMFEPPTSPPTVQDTSKQQTEGFAPGDSAANTASEPTLNTETKTGQGDTDSSTNPPPTTIPTTVPTTTTSTTTTTAATTTTTAATTATTEDVSLPSEGVLVRPSSLRRKAYNLSPPACMRGTGRAKTFLMVFMGHSGSTAIMSELKSHPQMYIDKWEPVDHGDIRENTSLALAYTREFFKRGLAEGKTPGFKIRPLHIKNDPKAWAALAREFDTRIIWQYRRNSLKQAVGEYSYRVLNDNSIVEGLKSEEEVKKRCDTGAGCTFPIEDFKAFHDILNSVTRSDFAIAEAAHLIADGRDCVHEMRYEDYLYHRKGAMMDILEFLGADLVDTQPERYKATNDNLCEVVSNWNDFCGAFYGCKVWRHLFEDKENGCSCRFSSSPSDNCATPSL